MSSKKLRPVLALAALCAGARPAFADGIPMPSDAQILLVLGLVLALFGFAIWVVVMIVRSFRRASRTPQDDPATPAVPTARVVRDSDKAP